MDLHDLQHNTRDGLHIASLAGAWIVAVCGFGGMRDHNGHLTFNPHLPARLTRLNFRLLFRGRRLKVDVTDTHATYTLLDGAPLEIRHHGNPVTISRDGPRQSRTRPSLPVRRRPSHPGAHPSTAASRQARPGLQGPRNQPGRVGALEKAATQPPGISP
jgi:alpha,alpha-trehalose phosphorylase